MFIVSSIFPSCHFDKSWSNFCKKLNQNPRQINEPCLYLFVYNCMLKLHWELLTVSTIWWENKYFTFLQPLFPVPQFRSQAHTSHYTHIGPGATFGGSSGMSVWIPSMFWNLLSLCEPASSSVIIQLSSHGSWACVSLPRYRHHRIADVWSPCVFVVSCLASSIDVQTRKSLKDLNINPLSFIITHCYISSSTLDRVGVECDRWIAIHAVHRCVHTVHHCVTHLCDVLSARSKCAVFAWNIALSSAVTFVLHCMDRSASVHPRVVLLVVWHLYLQRKCDIDCVVSFKMCAAWHVDLHAAMVMLLKEFVYWNWYTVSCVEYER